MSMGILSSDIGWPMVFADVTASDYYKKENKRRCGDNECNRFTASMETVSVCGMYGDVVFETFTTAPVIWQFFKSCAQLAGGREVVIPGKGSGLVY